jgi:hypothetical protein
MKRVLMVGICCAAACGATVSAWAGPKDLFDAQYQGKAERDPASYVGFDVVRGGGKRKVARVAAVLPYHCLDGASGRAFARVRGKLPIDDAGEFAGTLRGDEFLARGGDTSVTYRFDGRLRRRGKARGTIDGELRFPSMMRGGGTVRCYTGGLNWRTKRGADAAPVTRGQGRIR